MRILLKSSCLHIAPNCSIQRIPSYTQQSKSIEQPKINRRHLGGLAALLLVASPPPPSSFAAEGAELPRGYEKLARSLVENLRDSIDADLNGAPEQEVRRKADPAKDSVKQFLAQWRGSDEVKDEQSYKELLAAIQELGSFYTANGQRARITEEVGNKILDRIAAAELALPPKPEKKSLLPF